MTIRCLKLREVGKLGKFLISATSCYESGILSPDGVGNSPNILPIVLFEYEVENVRKNFSIR